MQYKFVTRPIVYRMRIRGKVHRDILYRCRNTENDFENDDRPPSCIVLRDNTRARNTHDECAKFS